eukprot:1189016-Prorocentrum_minimum.AAC.4
MCRAVQVASSSTEAIDLINRSERHYSIVFADSQLLKVRTAFTRFTLVTIGPAQLAPGGNALLRFTETRSLVAFAEHYGCAQVKGYLDDRQHADSGAVCRGRVEGELQQSRHILPGESPRDDN